MNEIILNETTLENARIRRSNFFSTMVPNLPLRRRAVIIAGPNDGFMVVRLSFALANSMEVVR